MILLCCFLRISRILFFVILSFSSNKTTLAVHADKNYSDSRPETSPKGDETKNSVSQTVMLIHGVQIDLSTVRGRYRDRGREGERHTQRTSLNATAGDGLLPPGIGLVRRV